MHKKIKRSTQEERITARTSSWLVCVKTTGRLAHTSLWRSGNLLVPPDLILFIFYFFFDIINTSTGLYKPDVST